MTMWADVATMQHIASPLLPLAQHSACKRPPLTKPTTIKRRSREEGLGCLILMIDSGQR